MADSSQKAKEYAKKSGDAVIVNGVPSKWDSTSGTFKPVNSTKTTTTKTTTNAPTTQPTTSYNTSPSGKTQAQINSEKQAFASYRSSDPQGASSAMKNMQRQNFIAGIDKAYPGISKAQKEGIIERYNNGTLSSTVESKIMTYVQSDPFGEVVERTKDKYVAPKARSLTKEEVLKAMDDDPSFDNWTDMKKKAVAGGYLDPDRTISDTWKAQIENAISPYMASQGMKLENDKVVPVSAGNYTFGENLADEMGNMPTLGSAGQMTNNYQPTGEIDDWINEYLNWDPANDAEFQSMVSDRTSRIGSYFDTLLVAQDAARLKELGGSPEEIRALREKGLSSGMSEEELGTLGLSGQEIEGSINRQERELGEDYIKAKEYADSDYAKELQKKSKNYAVATRAASEGYSSMGLYKSGIKRQGVLGMREAQAESLGESQDAYDRNREARETAMARAKEGFERNREDIGRESFANKFELTEAKKAGIAEVAPAEEARLRAQKLEEARLKEEQLRNKQNRSLTY